MAKIIDPVTGLEVTDPEALAHPEAYGLDPNAANGVNPLNTLSFDVNTLIPHKEMNWDVIEGMDDIHQSIMRGYGNVATGLVKDINKIDDKVKEVYKPIQESFVRQANNAASSVEATDTKVNDYLVQQMIPLCDKYGHCLTGYAWFLFWREGKDGRWYPFLEWATGGPQGKEYYGPFPNWYVLLNDRRRFDSIVTIHADDNSSSNQITQNMLQNLYNTNLSNLGLVPNQDGSVNIPGVTNDEYGPVIDIANFVINGGIGITNSMVNTNTENGDVSSLENGLQNITEVNPIVISNIITTGPNNDSEERERDSQSIPIPLSVPSQQQSTINLNNSSIVSNAPPIIAASSIPQAAGFESLPPLTSGLGNGEGTQDDAMGILPGSGSRDSTMGNTVLPMEVQLDKCCQALGDIAKGVSSSGGMGDLEYLYSDDGQKHISKFLEDNELARYEDMFPANIGRAIELTIGMAKKEVSIDG